MPIGIQITKTSIIGINREDMSVLSWCLKYIKIFKKARNELQPGSLVLHFDQFGDIIRTEFHTYEKVKKNGAENMAKGNV